ncbi:hypothetical protein VA596_34480 [Amycolatopsis sp., V23-08]|uniref:Secreted protein n=1 Tax=Amycolatopsis heterodermiae TaxID=3110235 RepID=A0ABU5REI8_9PSEU|nr:hypothetical protein [Amycolatopsis sp., V23-08]MEA5364682.1 hypothetical protein [Amycolatopsis sp., V23-08]
MHSASRRLATFGAAVLGLSALVTSVFTTSAGAAGAAGATAADDGPPPIVETYDYPGADRILAERNITLLKGDGHILLVDCASGGNLIVVQSYKIKGGDACFRVTGTPGYLTMQIPETYFIKGDGHTAKATLTAKSTTETVDIQPGQWTPVGESLPNHDPAALLEIRVTA